jgi:hypothetical protein
MKALQGFHSSCLLVVGTWNRFVMVRNARVVWGEYLAVGHVRSCIGRCLPCESRGRTHAWNINMVGHSMVLDASIEVNEVK